MSNLNEQRLQEAADAREAYFEQQCATHPDYRELANAAFRQACINAAELEKQRTDTK